ncbi:MAG: hypothetical protein WKG00_18035 [Polyangiaceae bacterium]
MGPVAHLDTAIAQHTGAIRAAAVACAAGGGPAWDAMLAHYGVARLADDERRQIVTAMRLSRGAVPAELRMLMAALERWALGQLAGLAATAGPEGDALAALERRLATLVDAETAAYERALGIVPAPPAAPPPAAAAPAPIGLASIFANAHETSKQVPWANQVYANVATLTCVHCGGPQETPADFMCRYCRRPIAGTRAP